MCTDISSKVDKFAFALYSPYKKSILKKIPESDNQLAITYGKHVNVKNKFIDIMIVVTDKSIYYVEPKPVNTLNSVSIDNISSMKIAVKRGKFFLNIESSGGLTQFVFAAEKSVNNLLSFVQDIKNQSQQQTQLSNHTTKSNFELIKELKELLDMGAITQEEFDQKKKELL